MSTATKPPRIRTGSAAAFAAAALVMATLGVGGAQADSGVPVLADDWMSAWEGTAGTPPPTTSIVASDAPGFDEALRIDVTAEPSNPYYSGEWSVAAGAPNATSIHADDAIVAGFWIRSVGTATGTRQANFLLEQDGGTYTKSLTVYLQLDSEWRYHEYGFLSRGDYDPGDAMVKLWLGYGQQQVEVAGLSVTNYGSEPPADFPEETYEGREADAPWREAANQRIQEHRTGDLRVIVAGNRGPVEGAEVHIEMTDHLFNFGHAAGAELITGTSSDAEAYRDVLLTNVNQVTLDNDLKWGFWTNEEFRNTRTLPAIEWLHENDMDLHGHPLIWPSWGNAPPYLQDLTPEELRAEVAAHITDKASTLSGDVLAWDVVNEPYSEHDMLDVLGQDVIADWFELAEAADPDSLKLLNDYGILSQNALNERKQDFIYDLLRDLIAADVPIDALGMQAHMGRSQLTPPEDLLPVLDRYAALGLGLQITEFDVATTDEQLQADYTRDFFTMAFSHPEVNAISTWGFWEGRYAASSAAMYRLDWTQKPNGAAWQDLVLNEWWTDEHMTTTSNGRANTRAFLGTYRVSVTIDGVTTTQIVEHTNTYGTTVVIRP